MLDLRVLGHLEVADGNRLLALGGPKQRAVLAMLALEANRVVSVDRLIEGVWGPDAPAQSVRSLQVYVSNLRKVLATVADGGVALVNRSPGYLLEVDPDRIDLNRYSRLAEEGRALLAAGRFRAAADPLDQAAALWRGPLLDDLAREPFASGGVLDRLAEDRLTIDEDRLEVALAMGRHAELLPELERMVEAEPLRERRWSLLMLALYRSGRQADALRTYARARAVLIEELGVDPGPDLRRLEGRILDQDPDLEASGRQALLAEPSRRVPVPRPLTSLVGRAEEVDELAALLGRDETCLVTLVGPGGVGKTRLAAAVARAAEASFPGGVAFADLAPLDDPDLVVGAVLASLGCPEPADRPLEEAVADELDGRRTLVVLDNLEQVLGAGPDLVRLLRAAPTLTLLGTSRSPLRVSGEVERPVHPLAIPRPHEARTPAELAAVPAVALFVERAGDATPGFALTEGNARHVVDICLRLDGLPLALELAAARTSTFRLEDLAARLGTVLDALPGAQDLPDRQRTLRATLEWSEALLTPADRDLLCRLAVFAGSFTLDTAEAVCPDVDLLGALGRLVDSSLVRAVPGPLDLRFGLLHTVRVFAAERLAAADGVDATRSRHAARLQELAAGARERFDGPESTSAVVEVLADEPDHRTALRHELAHGDPSRAGRHAVALRPFWVSQGRLSEGRRWLAEILAAAQLDEAVRAQAQVAAGALAYYQDDERDAVALLQAGLSAARRLGDGETTATALCFLGTTVLRDEGPTAAAPLVDEALDLATGADLYEPQVLALALAAITAALDEDLAAERRLREQRLALARARGDRLRVADTLNALAEIALDEGDHAGAAVMAEEALPLARATSRLTARDVLLTLGRVALLSGEGEQALLPLAEATRLSAEFAQPFELAQCLRALAAAAALRGLPEHAARLVGAAERLQSSLGDGPFPPEPDLDRHLEQLRASLGGSRYSRLVGDGGALDTAAAVDLGLSLAESSPERVGRPAG